MKPTLSQKIRALAQDAETPEARALILQAADLEAGRERKARGKRKVPNAWTTIADRATRQTRPV